MSAAIETAPNCPTKIEVFVGTYDNFLFSYCIIPSATDPSGFTFRRQIADAPHTSSIRCLATGRHYLATGSADDRISVLDLRTQQVCQLLTHHGGTINALAFTPDGSHLFSAADDGRLAATKTGSWLTDNVWRTPHSGKPIVALAVHPSGKLALTVGKDGTLRTWSLIKGRQCYTTNLRTLSEKGETIESVVWSPEGGRFVLVAVDRVLVMSVGEAAVERQWLGAGKRRVTAVVWLDEERLMLGMENGRVRFVRVAEEEGDSEDEAEAEEKEVEVEVHEGRVKAMAMLHGHLVTISCTSSTGSIALWRLDAANRSLHPLCTHSLGRRPICLALGNAALYRKETPVKAEKAGKGGADSDDSDAEAPAAPVAPVRRIVSTGRVTIETGDDDGDDDLVSSRVSVLQTPKAKKAKKRKQPVAEEQADEEDVEEPEEDEEEIVTPPVSKKKSKKAGKKQLIAVEPVVVAAKKNKRQSGQFEERAVVESPPKKSKKAKQQLLNQSVAIQGVKSKQGKAEGAGNRRKSNKI